MSQRAVIFDFGGVLIHQDWDDYDRFGTDWGLPQRAFLDILFHNEHWQRWQTGAGTREAWLDHVRREVRSHIGHRAGEMLAAWDTRPVPTHDANLDLARALHNAGHTIAVLSNAGPDLRRVMRDVHAIDVEWDDIVVSGEVGLAKPDQRIYRLTTERLGIAPRNVFFIDDIKANVAAAEEAGWTAHRFKGDYEALQADLRAHGYDW